MKVLVIKIVYHCKVMDFDPGIMTTMATGMQIIKIVLQLSPLTLLTHIMQTLRLMQITIIMQKKT